LSILVFLFFFSIVVTKDTQTVSIIVTLAIKE
jgi:hypothetical protein